MLKKLFHLPPVWLTYLQCVPQLVCVCSQEGDVHQSLGSCVTISWNSFEIAMNTNLRVAFVIGHFLQMVCIIFIFLFGVFCSSLSKVSTSDSFCSAALIKNQDFCCTVWKTSYSNILTHALLSMFKIIFAFSYRLREQTFSILFFSLCCHFFCRYLWKDS